MTKLLLILMMVGMWSGAWGEETKTYTEKHDNGKVKIQGNLVDGKRDGKWVEYFLNSMVFQCR